MLISVFSIFFFTLFNFRLKSEYQEAKSTIEQLKLGRRSFVSQTSEETADTVPSVSVPSIENSRSELLQPPSIDVFADESDQGEKLSFHYKQYVCSSVSGISP